MGKFFRRKEAKRKGEGKTGGPTKTIPVRRGIHLRHRFPFPVVLDREEEKVILFDDPTCPKSVHLFIRGSKIAFGKIRSDVRETSRSLSLSLFPWYSMYLFFFLFCFYCSLPKLSLLIHEKKKCWFFIIQTEKVLENNYFNPRLSPYIKKKKIQYPFCKISLFTFFLPSSFWKDLIQRLMTYHQISNANFDFLKSFQLRIIVSHWCATFFLTNVTFYKMSH